MCILQGEWTNVCNAMGERWRWTGGDVGSMVKYSILSILC